MDPTAIIIAATMPTFALGAGIYTAAERTAKRRKAEKEERRQLRIENAKLRAMLRSKEIDIQILLGAMILARDKVYAEHADELARIQAEVERVQEENAMREGLLRQKWLNATKK